MPNKVFYVSLCRGLSGWYVKFEAESEEVVRQHCAAYFGRMWCEVYSEAYYWEVLRKRYPRATRVVNRDKPIVLQGDNWQWE